MLIEFRVGNFLSFNQIVSLNMTASPDSNLEDTSVFTDSKYRLPPEGRRLLSSLRNSVGPGFFRIQDCRNHSRDAAGNTGQISQKQRT